MKIIHKYPIDPVAFASVCSITMPADAEILSVQTQNERAVMWVKVDRSKTEEYRNFFTAFTGEPLPDNPSVFIGTFQLGKLVYHLFELLK